MKKKFLGATMCMLVVSSLSANNDLQNDLDFAFGGEVQANSVTVLNDAQMSEIQGKGFRKAFRKVVKAVIQTPAKQVVKATSVALGQVTKPMESLATNLEWSKIKFVVIATAAGAATGGASFALTVGSSSVQGFYNAGGRNLGDINSNTIGGTAIGAVKGVGTYTLVNAPYGS